MKKMKIKDTFAKYYEGEEYLEHIHLKDTHMLKRLMKKRKNKRGCLRGETF